MKRSLETLKTYFETGDVPVQPQYEDVFDSLVHKDDAVIPNTVFIDNLNGDDTSAEVGSVSQRYKTIDAAVAAFETAFPRQGDITDLTHQFLHVVLLSNGTYEINQQLPQRNIRFQSKEVCTIDFSNNTNEYLNVLEAGVYHTYAFSLPNGKLLNSTENKLFGGALFFEGEFDTIESYGAPYAVFGKGFITANQVKVKYNLLKGSGTVFSTLGTNSINTFTGNIESVGAQLMVNNEGQGVSYFDFDEAKGTHKLGLIRASLAGVSYVNFGKHKPDVVTEIMKIAPTGKLYVSFKENAETYGSFNAGETHFSGGKVTINSALARLQNKLFLNSISLVANTTLCTLINGNAQLYIKNSHLEVASSITAIETNTNFANDCVVFIGQNSIYQTGTPGADLVTKYATAEPTNVSYRVTLKNSLVTNGILNTTIAGNTNTTATLNLDSTTTY